MNCLIETLSLIKNLNSESEYIVTDKSMLPQGVNQKTFKGRQTNETPTQYFFWSLMRKEKMPDKIIVLVTKECMNENIETLQGLTTYQYYYNSIKEYINSLISDEVFLREYLEKNFDGSSEKYIEKIMTPLFIPESSETSAWKDIVQAVLEYRKTDEQIDLYCDLTGGSRVASLTSFLLMKIMENMKANVKQIIYSDITVRPYHLTDCTRIYQILSNIENIAKANENSENVTRKIMSELVKMGLTSEEEAGDTQTIDDLAEKSRKSFGINRKDITQEKNNAISVSAKNNSPEAKQPDSAISRLVKEQQISNIKMQNKKSDFIKLKETRTKNTDLILDFHEMIFSIFYQNGIIVYNGTDNPKYAELSIKNEIKANETYYYYYKKAGYKTIEKGIVPFVKKLMGNLYKNQLYSPLKTYQIYLSLEKPEYINSVNYERYIKGISWDENKKFLAYLESINFPITEKSFSDLLAVQRVFYNYGFPFMCTSVGNGFMTTYPRIMDYYRQQTLGFFQKLEDIKNSDKTQYPFVLKKYLDDEKLIEQELPPLFRTDNWSLNQNKFESPEASDTFLKTLQQRIEKVRPFRNAIAHNLDNQYSTPAAKNSICTEIKSWLDEYDRMFASDE